MKVCLRYKKNKEDAHSLLNLSFLKILDGLKSLDQASPFEPWIRRIAINTAIDEFRKNKKHSDTELQNFSEEYWSGRLSEANQADEEFNAEQLRNLIRTLPDISQQVFNLCVLDGFGYDEIASKLDITEATCRWHVHFARKTLKALISKGKLMINTVML